MAHRNQDLNEDMEDEGFYRKEDAYDDTFNDRDTRHYGNDNGSKRGSPTKGYGDAVSAGVGRSPDHS